TIANTEESTSPISPTPQVSPDAAEPYRVTARAGTESSGCAVTSDAGDSPLAREGPPNPRRPIHRASTSTPTTTAIAPSAGRRAPGKRRRGRGVLRVGELTATAPSSATA